MKSNLQAGCTVQPQTKEELVDIIRDAIVTYGKEVDLNFIDTSKITDMSYLFASPFPPLFSSDYFSGYGFDNFNGNISKWDVSNVKDMSYMFLDNFEFNQPLNDWDVSHVTNMYCMFSDAESFNQPLDQWDVSNVTEMENMFCGAKNFNQPLDKWNVSNVKNMSRMFAYSSFNQPLDKWNISNVKDMSYMFDNCPIDYRNLPNQDYNIVFVEAAKDDPELLKTSGKYIKFDRIWKVPKQDFNNDNLELINKLCFKTFDDVLACTPMSKSELTKFILTNQNELSKKQQIDNKQLNSKNRSINR